ncbi:MAG: alpha/beta hydrolase [Deltaproteobacteria bacterium]|nr:alpha/beta hydrolase [Deltaproteobacteria bacterium]
MTRFELPPPPGRHIQAGGLHLHYVEDGRPDGPPLLLLHGLLASTYVWQKVRPALGRHFRLIMPDLPGHGYSEKPDGFSMHLLDQAQVVADFLTALGIPRARVVGQSMGGGISMLLAARFPERVEQLVLVDSVCFPFDLPLKGRLAVVPGLGYFLLRYLYRRPILADFMRKDVYFDPRSASDEEIDVMYAHMNTPVARRAMHRGILACHQPAWLAPEIAQVKAPTLILWGEKDALFPPVLGEQLQRTIAGSRLVVFPSCGHAMMFEMPDRFCQEALGFFGVAE